MNLFMYHKHYKHDDCEFLFCYLNQQKLCFNNVTKIANKLLALWQSDLQSFKSNFDINMVKSYKIHSLLSNLKNMKKHYYTKLMLKVKNKLK